MVDVRPQLRKILPVLLKAREDNLNEADTAQRLAMFFSQVLGYDPLTEITREVMVKEKYVDFALKIEGNVKLLVEAKAAGVDLRERHIEQAKTYAAEANIRWVLLTNGVVWSLYHLTFEEGIEYERVLQVDLAADDLDVAAAQLALLHRRSVAGGKHEEFWERHAALEPSSLAKAIYNESVLRLMRRDIRRRVGILVDEEELARAVHEMLSPEAREKIGPVKIRRRHVFRRAAVAGASPGASSAGPPDDPEKPI
ncbi:MAG: type I restriction enzyme HsdR N-terminal domain-containing protein [Acidobacteria bacterium]|nr:type I restriction enzyme HsdR N-terminal domain-containing protein [Acidobacteriota bacterium]